MFITTLKQLEEVASENRRICSLDGNILGRRFLDASILLGQSKEVIKRQFEKRLVIYKPVRRK